jgi:hypothetical protein
VIHLIELTFNVEDNQECIFSTYTDSYHSYMDFSQNDKFNEKELEKLLNNLVASCKIEYEKEVAALGVVVDPNLEEKINELNGNPGANSRMSEGVSRNGYQGPLDKLNAYLAKFNPETYRDIEVKEGKVYFSFAVYTMIYHSFISIDDLKNNVSIAQGNAFGDPQIRMRCNDDRKCFYSNYSNDYTDHFRFFSTTVEDLSELDTLLKDFIQAL